jgi:hypothetical protein
VVALVQDHQVHVVVELLRRLALAQRLDGADGDSAFIPLAITDLTDHLLRHPGVLDEHPLPLVDQFLLVNQDVSLARMQLPDQRAADRRLARAGGSLVDPLLVLDQRTHGGGLVVTVMELLEAKRRPPLPLAPVKPPDTMAVLTQQQLVFLRITTRHHHFVTVGSGAGA